MAARHSCRGSGQAGSLQCTWPTSPSTAQGRTGTASACLCSISHSSIPGCLQSRDSRVVAPIRSCRPRPVSAGATSTSTTITSQVPVAVTFSLLVPFDMVAIVHCRDASCGRTNAELPAMGQLVPSTGSIPCRTRLVPFSSDTFFSTSTRSGHHSRSH